MSSAEYENLLSQSAWVRDLARRLVRDPDLADDLAQEAWLAAMRTRWTEVQSPRAWMATVLRRSLRERLRGEERRTRREQDSARPAAVEADPADIVARASAHRDVVEAVMQLPEHYRLVVLRRYFDGESPTEIARATDVPVATVKTRLQRGLAALREKLDDKHGGDGRSWAVALVPLVEHQPTPTGLAAVAPAQVAAGVAVGMVALALVVIAMGPFGAGPPDRQSYSSASPSIPSAPALASLDVAEAETGRRTLAGTTPASSAPGAAVARGLTLDAQPRRSITADVRDLDGRLLPGVLVRFESDRAASTAIAISDEGGRARLRTAAPPGLLDSGDGAWAAVTPVRVTEHSDRRVTLVVAPRVERSGRTIDEFGNGVGAVELAVELPAPAGPGAAQVVSLRVTSDAGGEFQFSAPDVAGTTIAVAAPGREPLRFAVAELGPMPWTIVLPSVGDHALRGRVVDGAGAPIEGARLALAGSEVPLDVDGSFSVAGRPGRLVAWAPGYASAGREVVEGGATEIELELLPVPDLVGVVRDSEGEPVAGALVWDTTAVPVLWGDGLGDVLWLTAEIGAAAVDPPVEFPPLGAAAVETGSGWNPVRADSLGRFVLHGDPSRDRHLVALAPRTHDAGELSIAAGISAGCEVLLEHPARAGAIEGRVIDPSGAPQVGVGVESMVHALSARFGERVVEVGFVLEAGTRTDQAGWFQLQLPQPVNHCFQLIGGRGLPRRAFFGLRDDAEAAPGRALRGIEISMGRAIPLELRGGWPREARLVGLDAESEWVYLAHRSGRHVEWFEGSVAAARAPVTLLAEARLAEVRVEAAAVEVHPVVEAQAGGVVEIAPLAGSTAR